MKKSKTIWELIIDIVDYVITGRKNPSHKKKSVKIKLKDIQGNHSIQFIAEPNGKGNHHG